MMQGKKITGFVLVLAVMLLGFGIPEKLQKKVDKEIEKVFGANDFTLKPINVPASLNAQLPAKITAHNFFKLTKDSEVTGYIFVDNAPSKTAKFDYLVVFDANLSVIHSKILIYREEYGGEIGSKRWLQQFTGKTGKDRVDHETNIDGISGATISVRSMTTSMDNLLQTVGILQDKKLL
ncbi:FMN-binding protein [Arenibacter sp. F26102]|uniref:FMN-binding protein n=1 Tax=Arenibacter sp. F26102 TaxID=2926416 RepID=UPI001FF2BCFD|nr:FMN-binding protein [Arenibacter sp. F26102]MCK0147593.1 FMN-binding protein [Arenibacter sp. F26102]